MSPKPQNNSIMNKESLGKLTVKQIQVLLREKGCTVSGNKAELIDRLEAANSSGCGREESKKSGLTKPKPWQHSSTKKELKRALLDPTSPIHNMTIDEIHKSHNGYKQYPNFPKYYRKLKARVDEEMAQVKADDIAVEEHLRNNPRKELNRRGYPHWDTHAAKRILQSDIANKSQERWTPSQLRKTQDVYKESNPEVFAKRVSSEIAKQKAAKFWTVKRNKKGMMKYLNNSSVL